jgi:hypothetical protein
VRWLLSAEELPAPAPDTGQRGDRFVPWLLADGELPARPTDAAPSRSSRRFLTWLFAPEPLTQLPAGDAPASPRRSHGFWGRLFSPEPFPSNAQESAQPVPRVRFLRWVVSREECPQVLAQHSPRRAGFLSDLLAADVCPSDAAAPAPPARRHFLDWLLSRENL